MIIKGSLNYTTNGRKKQRITRKRKRYEFKELKTLPFAKEDRMDYPSRKPRVCETAKMRFPEVHGHTVAPAYNKGAYQVIPISDIKYIGK